MKAVRKFKGLVERKRPSGFHDALDKGKRRFRSSPDDGLAAPPLVQSKSEDTYDRSNIEGVLAAEGIHTSSSAQLSRTVDRHAPYMNSPESEDSPELPEKNRKPPRFATPPHLNKEDSGEKGHAQDPLAEAPLFLGIGAGGVDLDSFDATEEPSLFEGVAESPTAAEFSIYDTAYQEEVERIRAAQGKSATVYLTRRVDGKKEYKEDKNMIDEPNPSAIAGGPREGLKAVLDRARDKADQVKVEAGKEREKREDREKEKAALREGVPVSESIPPAKPEGETKAEREERHEQEKEIEKERERKRDKGMKRFSQVAAKAVANTKSFGSDLSSKGGETMDRVMKRVGVGKEKAVSPERVDDHANASSRNA